MEGSLEAGRHVKGQAQTKLQCLQWGGLERWLWLKRSGRSGIRSCNFRTSSPMLYQLNYPGGPPTTYQVPWTVRTDNHTFIAFSLTLSLSLKLALCKVLDTWLDGRVRIVPVIEYATSNMKVVQLCNCFRGCTVVRCTQLYSCTSAFASVQLWVNPH